MNRDKLLAIGAYGVQAASTLGTVFAVSHLLEPTHYGAYSLVVATSQTVAVLAAEWIRLATQRFCSTSSLDLPSRVATVQCAFLLVCILLAIVGTGISWSGWIAADQVMSGLGIAVLMGATDLQLVFLRVRGSLKGFAQLQAIRALLLLLLPTTGALLTHSATGALLGLNLGYLLSLALFVRADPSWWRVRPSLFNGALLREMARYGVAAAGASMLHALVPISLRLTAQTTLAAPDFAGFSLALDLLQKPYALATTALGGILTPGVIQEHEESPHSDRPRLKQLYETLSWTVILILGGALAFIPEAKTWLVSPALGEGFEMSAPAIAMIFAGHVFVQTVLSIPAHLLKHGHALIGNAAVEAGGVGIVCAASTVLPGMRPVSWLWWSLGAVLLACLYCLRLIRSVPCPTPVTLLTTGPALAVAFASLSLWHTEHAWAWALLKVATFATIMLAGAWLIRQQALRQAQTR